MAYAPLAAVAGGGWARRPDTSWPKHPAKPLARKTGVHAKRDAPGGGSVSWLGYGDPPARRVTVRCGRRETPTVELFCGGRVGGFDDLAGAQATSADVYPFDASADDGANPLDIRIPAALGPNMRMADAHAKRRFLIADLTYRSHDDS